MNVERSRAGYCSGEFDLPTLVGLAIGSRNESSVGIFLKVEPNTLIWKGRREGDGSPVVYKMYRNRGCIGWIREGCFQFRVEREYQALSHLVRHGIRCSVPFFWTRGHDPEHGRYEILCMREIQQATALTELVSSGHQNAIDIGVLYVMVRHMHETGFYHGRLDLRNIVRGIDADGVSDYHIIDTPYAMIFPGSIAGTAMAWDDLRQLSGYVYRIWGTEVVRAGLIGYGLGKKESHKMMGILPRSGVPLLMRNLKRFYFGLRLRFFYKYEIF